MVAIEIRADYPGKSAEEVERQVTIPVEAVLNGMPRLESLRSTTIPGTSIVFACFEPGSDYSFARQEIIDRFQEIPKLPIGVVPMLSPGRTMAIR